MFTRHAGAIPGFRVGLVAVALLVAGTLSAEQPAAKTATPIDKGQHVYITGNSFQVFVDHHLKVMTDAAGIKGHIRGGDPLAVTKVDVVACNPWFVVHDKADKGLEDLTDRALRHNPDARVLAQISWMPFDDPVYQVKGREKTDWSARTMQDVRNMHAPFIKNANDQVESINKRLGKQVVFIVPTAQAVMALREKVAAGQAPGLKSPDDLFTDAIGHARPAVESLNGYCHFAVIYRRSPVGLEIKGAKDEKLQRFLQELAWDAVCKEPLSGVKTP